MKIAATAVTNTHCSCSELKLCPGDTTKWGSNEHCRQLQVYNSVRVCVRCNSVTEMTTTRGTSQEFNVSCNELNIQISIHKRCYVEASGRTCAI